MPTHDRAWVVANVVVVIAVDITLVVFVGPWALGYLVLSTVFALGLHPIGGRWIQEHFVTRPGQETYSYYGPLDTVALNVGYHNEHHDFAGIPWNRLPTASRRWRPSSTTRSTPTRRGRGSCGASSATPSLSLYSQITRPERPIRATAPATPTD